MSYSSYSGIDTISAYMQNVANLPRLTSEEEVYYSSSISFKARPIRLIKSSVS